MMSATHILYRIDVELKREDVDVYAARLHQNHG